MKIDIVEMTLKEFLSKYDKTMVFSPDTHIIYPSMERRLGVEHKVFMSHFSDDEITENTMLERFYNKNEKAAEKLENVVVKNSFWKCFRNSFNKKVTEDLLKDRAEIIQKLRSMQYAQEEIKSFLYDREQKLNKVVRVPDISLKKGDSIFAVMLCQDLAIKELNDGFKVVDLVEYEISNVRINNKSDLNEKNLDYDIVYDIKFKDREGAYDNLSIKIKEDAEGNVDLIQNYTKLKFFFYKDMAESFFKETKEKILKSLTN